MSDTLRAIDHNGHTPGPLESDAVQLGRLIADALTRIDDKLDKLLGKVDRTRELAAGAGSADGLDLIVGKLDRLTELVEDL